MKHEYVVLTHRKSVFPRDLGHPKVATRHFVRGGGMADPWWAPEIVQESVVAIVGDEPIYVCDSWWTKDPTIIEDERTEWWSK